MLFGVVYTPRQGNVQPLQSSKVSIRRNYTYSLGLTWGLKVAIEISCFGIKRQYSLVIVCTSIREDERICQPMPVIRALGSTYLSSLLSGLTK